MSDLEDYLGGLVFVFGILAFIVTIIAFLMAWECSSYQEMTNKQTKLSGGSCYVKDGNEWYRWDEYKYRFATNGVRK